MNRHQYAAYRHTARWKDLVAQLHVRAGRCCEAERLVHLSAPHSYHRRCAATIRLQAHHRTYDRLGHETLDDLMLLCVRCHLVAHLLQTECPRCGVPALEDWEAWELIDDMDAEDLAAPDVFARVFSDARYEIEHWPFCQVCDDLNQENERSV